MNPVPVHQIPARRAAPGGLLPFASVARAGQLAPTPHDPSGLELGMGALMRFKSMMAAEGQDVQLARMCWDRLYAYERFAAAHAGSDESLRALALELFQIYHRCSNAGLAPQ